MKVLNQLRYYLFRRRLEARPKRQATYMDYTSVRSVLILFESDILERNPFIKEVVRALTQDGKDVCTWGYAAKKDVQAPILPQSRILGTKDVTFLGDLTPSVKQDLEAIHCDLLIDLTQTDCLALHNVALYADARFKVGRRIVDGLLDFMIDMPEEETGEPLYHQLIHYLTTIQRHD